MKIVLLALGKLKSAPLRELTHDYLSRLRRYGPTEIIELKAADPGLPNQAVAQESARILATIEPADKVFVLDERGLQVTSVELSKIIGNEELQAVKRMVFVLGGAYGFGDSVRARGRMLALSKLTFPHEFCRAIVLEQLYRARTILHGEPYHHG